MTDAFDPTDPASWIGRGRAHAHAIAIAGAWRDFPDLPPDAPLAERMARGRDSIAAMRPINEEISRRTEAERQARNFAFTDEQLRCGKGDDRAVAILRGRDLHGYDWDIANRYADGWYAAHAGWPHHYPDGIPCSAPLAVRHAAYDRGFADGGGDRHDLFDAARRANLARLRASNAISPTPPPRAGRPLPSTWPKPSDAPRPACWSRRLVILDEADVTADASWNFLGLIRNRAGAGEAKVLVLASHGSMEDRSELACISCGGGGGAASLARQLRDLLAGREFDDILVALRDTSLPLLDTVADALPLCRTMERTRNSRLQRRQHLRIWLDRGYDAGANVAAGHIRWRKVIHGRSGRLGEFTARHVGPAPGGGHLIRVETAGGELAHGYADAEGVALDPEIMVRTKAAIRSTIATSLRTFGAATSLLAMPRALAGQDKPDAGIAGVGIPASPM